MSVVLPESSKIAVLFGGSLGEYRVSVRTSACITKALHCLGYYDVREISINSTGFCGDIVGYAPDVAVLAAHGSFGENGSVQGLLEMLKIPYTHSRVMASSVAINKPFLLNFCSSIGINCVRSAIVNVNSEDFVEDVNSFGYPCVIKPVDGGSSLFTSALFSRFDAEKFCTSNTGFGRMLLQEYVSGIDVTSAVFLNRSLGSLEIHHDSHIFDNQTKYDSDYQGNLRYYFDPCLVPLRVRREAEDISLLIHGEIGCATISRSDFRYDVATGKLFFLELNTHPGLYEDSLFSIMLREDPGSNMTLEDVICELMCDAVGSKEVVDERLGVYAVSNLYGALV